MSNHLTVSMNTGTYGECHVMYSRFTKRDGTAPIAIVHHGHGGRAFYMIHPDVSPGILYIMEYLALNGYIVVVGDFANNGNVNQWGNDVNHAAIIDARAYGMTHGGSPNKKVLLIGESMGAVSTLTFAGRYAYMVAGCIEIIPACDTNVYKYPGADGPKDTSGNPYSFASTIDAAYPGGYNDAVHGAEHNPKRQAEAGAFSNMPIQLWYGNEDTFAPYALVNSFYNRVKSVSAGAPITINRIPGTQAQPLIANRHDDVAVSRIPKQAILNFAKSVVS